MGLEREVEKDFGLKEWGDFIVVPSSIIRALVGCSRQGTFKGGIVDRIAEPICYGFGILAELERLGVYFYGCCYIVERISG